MILYTPRLLPFEVMISLRNYGILLGTKKLTLIQQELRLMPTWGRGRWEEEIWEGILKGEIPSRLPWATAKSDRGCLVLAGLFCPRCVPSMYRNPCCYSCLTRWLQLDTLAKS